MSLPYFPMYPADFEADTSHLTLAEDGAYNRLLRLMWMAPGNSLPDDDAWITRRMRCHSDEDRRVVMAIISEFFVRSNGRVSNARLTKEFEKISSSHEKRVIAGSKGGKAKSLKSLDAAPSNAKAMLKQPEPEPEPKKRDTNVSLDQKSSSPRSSEQFESWWKLVPKKTGKGNARAAYARALKKTTPEILEAQIKAYAQTRAGEDPQFTAHPATWLNAERWTDEAPAPMAPRMSAQQPSVDRETYGQEAARVLGRIGAFADQVGEEPRVIQFAGGRA